MLEQILRILRPPEAYFWATHQGAELDLLIPWRGRRYGVEVKYSDSPRLTKSEQSALETLELSHLWVVHSGKHSYPVGDRVSVIPVEAVNSLESMIEATV